MGEREGERKRKGKGGGMVIPVAVITTRYKWMVILVPIQDG